MSPTAFAIQSTSDKAQIRRRLRGIQSLGPTFGLGIHRRWARVSNKKKDIDKFSSFPRINECIGVTDNDMESAFGRKWPSLFESPKELSGGFEYATLSDCHFISVMSSETEVVRDRPTRINGIKKDELNLVRNKIEATCNPTEEMQLVDEEEEILDVDATATPSHRAGKKSTSLISPDNNGSYHNKVVPSAAKTNGGERSPSADVGKIISVDVSVQNESWTCVRGEF